MIQLLGFRELENALRQLPKATGKNVLRRVARGALEPMANMAAARAPHRTGRLAFSISVSEKRTRRATVRKSNGRFRSDPSTGITMAMGPAGGFGGALMYASFDEFGTVDTPAFAYMRSAWDAGAAPALQYIIDNLKIEIDRAAMRYAKKKL